MKSIIVSILLAATMVVHAQSTEFAADTKLKAKLQQEIEYIGSLYGSVYAPKAWKESHLGWNLASQVALAQAKLAAAQSMKEAREAVGGLIRSTADYHVSYSFYSTEKATLPFQVKTVEGKSLIVFIDREKLSEKSFPFQVGDELLTMGQAPVAQVIEEIKKLLGANVPETDAALADIYVTRRSGRGNYPVPHGPVTVSIKRAANGTVGTIQLAWEYAPEQLSIGHNQPFFLKRPENKMFQLKMLGGVARELMNEKVAGNNFGMGIRESFLPDFGKRVWEAGPNNTFDAYIYENEAGQKVGVVRIFGYIVDDYKKAITDFSAIVEQMEKETTALIIDQNNNPGGSVFYLYGLASMLSDQVLTVPRHRQSMLPSSAKECLELLNVMPMVKSDAEAEQLFGDTQGYPATFQLAMGTADYCRSLLIDYRSGKALSEPLFLWGVDKINPNPVHYTKPIVILTNPLDFSGGDFFPAIMQDNKRATIVGTRTAGAGGFILEAEFPNAFGLESISFTGSIAERVNNNPIENLGVTPDIHLPMTVEDHRNGFKAYMDGVKAVVRDLTAAGK